MAAALSASNALAARPAAAAVCHARSRRPSGPPPCRRALRLAVAAAGRRVSEADLYQGIAPPEAPQPQSAGPLGQPWYVVVPAGFFGLIAVLRTARALKKKMSGGGRLEERGFKRGAVADDKAYSRAMKNMRTVKFEELPPEVIEAARRRRQREVAKDQLPDLDSIELPENHPFAVKKQLAPEEERLQRSRFSARRGLSEEDMRKLREQQALADKMDAEEEARQAAMRRRS